MRILALSAIFIAMFGAASAQDGAQWSYQGKNGPMNWGKLDSAYRACKDGQEQSPIDIRGAHLNKNLPAIEFHYLAASLTLLNNGHTIQAQVHPGSYVVWDGVRYNLEQFHFHHPSEEAVNGKLTDMDIHLVHRSEDGKLLVIAVRLGAEIGTPNAMLAALWNHLPTQEGQTEHVQDMINPAGLLPGDRGYWTYVGSLTTPPCTEGVRWFVMEQPVSISRTQSRQFATIFRVNSRPLQDTHGRPIEANK